MPAHPNSPRGQQDIWGMTERISPKRSSRNRLKLIPPGHVGQKQLFWAVHPSGGHLLPVRSASLPNYSLLLHAQSSHTALTAPGCHHPAQSTPAHLADSGRQSAAGPPTRTPPGWMRCSPRCSPNQSQGLYPIALLPKQLLIEIVDPPAPCSPTPLQTATSKGRKYKCSTPRHCCLNISTGLKSLEDTRRRAATLDGAELQQQAEPLKKSPPGS